MCMLNRDAARYIYLRDEQSRESWNLGFGPLCESVEDYACTHAIGYSAIRSRRDGITAEWRIFVPTDLTGECWTLWLENTSESPRMLSVFPTVSFSLDGFSHPRYYEMYRSIETSFDEKLNGVYCRSAHPFAPHRRYNGYLASSEPVFAFDGDLTAFFGALSTQTETDAASSARYQRPKRLLSGENCSNSDGALFIPGAVLQHKLTLLPGERREIRLVFGAAESIEEAQTSAALYTAEDAQSAALKKAEAAYREKYAALSVQTPDEKLNRIMNLWLKKQVDFCIATKVVMSGTEVPMDKDRPQWSVQGALGVQYNIIPQLGIYIEPGVKHYFNNHSRVRNFFKDKPNNFNLQFGLRLNVGN